MRPLIVTATALVGTSVVALGAYWAGQLHAARAPIQSMSPESPTAGEPSADNDKLAEAVGQLNRRLAALEVQQLAPKPSEKGGATPQPSAEQQFDPALARQRELEKAAAIDAALKAQTRDKVWAAATESQLQTAVDGALRESGANYSIKALRCLTSICEMVLSASSPDQLHGTDISLGPRISGMSSVDIVPLETAADGSATVTYRLFRQGFPRPDEGT